MKVERKQKKLKTKVKLSGGIFVALLLLLCFPAGVTSASTGNITVQLPEGVDSKVLYCKVATMYNGEWQLDETFKDCQVNLNEIDNAGQLTEVAEGLKLYAYENQIEMKEGENKDRNKDVCLTQLEEGLYLVVMEENDVVTISPALVSLPGWIGEEMSYEVRVIPKVTVIPEVTETTSSPKTGWNSKEGLYAGMAVTAFALIVLGLAGKRRGCFK